MSDTEIKLSAKINRAKLRADFAKRGRVHIRDVLEEGSAKSIHGALLANDRWNLVFDHDGRHRDLDAAGMAAIGQEKMAEFLRIVHAQATTRFQYLFSNFPMYEVYHRKSLPGHALNRVFEFLNSAPVLSLVKAITGANDIGFADAQATRYSAGHFLTVHDDGIEGKDRRVAYVLNFTPEWRPDWGGQLQFIGEDGHVEHAYVPAFNALNLFKVPKPHAVSIVAPFAGGVRYSITGWFRAGEDPGP